MHKFVLGVEGGKGGGGAGGVGGIGIVLMSFIFSCVQMGFNFYSP